MAWTGIESGGASATEEVEDEDHQRDEEEEMDEATGDMESESAAPED